MSGHADEFVRDAPGVRAATTEREGTHLHVYLGELADVEGQVRFLTVAPGVDEGAKERFVRAAGKWGNADTNPNIVPVYALDDEPRPWIAVGNVAGQPLDAVQSSLSPAERRAIVLDVGEALRNAALYNTYHQDLRPDRIWVVPGGDGVTALVDDWGLERAVRAAVGDPDVTPFTAPEAVADGGSIDERTDVYGLGSVAYYVLTGQPPVTASVDIAAAIGAGDVTPPSDLDDTLPTDVDDVLLRALATDPAERYDSAYAFIRAFGVAYMPPGADDTTTAAAGAVTTAGAASGDDEGTAGASSEDGESLLTRRRVLGILGVGSLGVGGGWMIGGMGGDDRTGPATVDTVTPRATPGAATATNVTDNTNTSTPAATETPTATPTPTETPADPDASMPAHDGLAYHDGTIYLVDGGIIKAIDRASGAVTGYFDVPDGSRPRGLAYGNGSLWFADRIGPDYEGEIAELEPGSGEVRSSIRSSWDPRGLAFGEGSLWAVDITANRIVEYSPEGEAVSAFNTDGVTWGLGLAYFEGTLWLGNNCNLSGCTVSLRQYGTDGELLQETERRTEVGYGGLAATEAELLGPDADGTLTVLRTL